ncbi:hypothetical protein BDV59DRAFT_184560 [Aspergillus ambiguus]|uniref:uncharacterized protein n=1 Tax=Aspergillus ambiguus TaxID=176160 RepID=UPI003CCCAE89
MGLSRGFRRVPKIINYLILIIIFPMSFSSPLDPPHRLVYPTGIRRQVQNSTSASPISSPPQHKGTGEITT